MNKRVFWILSIGSILLLWFFQYKITVNIPWWDDFHGIILPVYDLFNQVSFIEKFKSFVSLNNEHRVINDRIFTFIIYLFTGKFELKILAMLGFLNLVGVFLIFVRVLKGINKLAILPIAFLIFHAQYYESLQSLMVPFQNFAVLFYMALSFYFLTLKENTKWAFIFTVAAFLSHGNGILIFPIGVLVLLLNKNKKHLVYWSILSILAILIYFLEYSKPAWVETDVISPFQSPIASIRYVFEFLGAYSLNLIEFSDRLNYSVLRQIVPQLFGLFLVITLAFMFYKTYLTKPDFLKQLRKDKLNQFIIAFCLFFLGTAVLMGLTRTGFPVLSRYTINSSMFIISIWAFYIVNSSKKGSGIFTIFTLIILVVTYYNNTYKAVNFKNNLIADAFNYQQNGTWVNNYSDLEHVKRVNPLLTEPLKSGKYEFPPSIFDDYSSLKENSRNENLNYSIVEPYLNISGNSEGNTIYFGLESTNNKFIFPAKKQKNNPLKMIRSFTYFSDSYHTYFPYLLIPPGQYQIFKMELTGNDIKKTNLNRQLDTKGIVY